jgi:hypothetical protein
MIPMKKKIRIITRSRYSAGIYHSKKNGARFLWSCFCSAPGRLSIDGRNIGF